MWAQAREIAAGDLVIVWLTRDVVQPLLITPGKDFNSKFGHYRHSDFIGIPYGSKVGSRNGKGFIHILRPTPELWTMALPHRTQILYLADIAFVTSWLDMRRGSRIIEAGTGSGSFSHSAVRTIGPTGHLWSYEFHEARANKARDEFKQHGMEDTVTLVHRNVCKDGFTVTDAADAVFLDLPAPWLAVEHAKKALRKDRIARICCFSPCMEQVLRTVSALNDAAFTGAWAVEAPGSGTADLLITDITMYETLLRPHEVNQVPALTSIEDVAEKLKAQEQKREEKRLRQIAAARARVQEENLAKRKREEEGADAVNEDSVQSSSKKSRLEIEEAPQAMETDSAQASLPTDPQQRPRSVVRGVTTSQDADGSEVTKIHVSKVLNEVRGHTSYLTFACLLPNVSMSRAEALRDEKESS